MQQFIEEYTTSQIIPSLSDFVRIPNLSPQFDPEWATNNHLNTACSHLMEWISKQPIPNMTVKKMQIEGVPAAIHVDIQGSSDKTVLFYGHYDKQPHFTGWKEGLHPTKPVQIGDRLYGRGVADDGYAAYAAIATIMTQIAAKEKYPHCVILIEGEEESGSTKLMEYVKMLNLKSIDLMVALDSGCGDYDRLWLTGSLRGSIKLDINIKILNEGVHSGDGSGIVPSAFNIFRELMNRLEDSKTGKCHKKLFTLIPPDRYKEAVESAPIVSQSFPLTADKMDGDIIENYLNRTWRPTISYIGQTGLPPSGIAGNVCLPELTFRISIRIPPNLDSMEAALFMQQLLQENPPHQATVKVRIVSNGTGLNIKQSAFSQILQKGSQIYFKQDMRVVHEGASIPFLNQLASMSAQTELLVVGVLGPDSNAHGPNEMLDLKYMKGMIGCIAMVLNEI